MSHAKAISKYVRISPRKARLAAGLIRGKMATEAAFQLKHCNMKGGLLLMKTLKSAVANAESLHNARPEDLRVVEVRVDAGSVMKRSKPKNKGGRHPIMKRTSHFTIIVNAVKE